MYDNLSIEEVVDELKKVRDLLKDLKTKESILKFRINSDGRDEIKGNKFTMKATLRTKEIFNEEAFIETFKNDNNFDDELKSKILEKKLVINELNLKEACEDGTIPIDYVVPFNSITQTKVISVK